MRISYWPFQLRFQTKVNFRSPIDEGKIFKTPAVALVALFGVPRLRGLAPGPPEGGIPNSHAPGVAGVFSWPDAIQHGARGRGVLELLLEGEAGGAGSQSVTRSAGNRPCGMNQCCRFGRSANGDAQTVLHFRLIQPADEAFLIT